LPPIKLIVAKGVGLILAGIFWVILVIALRFAWFDTWQEFTVGALVAAGWGVLWLAYEAGRRAGIREATETDADRERRRLLGEG
jgi:hypothetical protein